ncbi:MAG: beta-propeller fold lactonase family protein, partial [Pseudomonadota bacterium]|nr:beta-propeller fold lactonase family protein [Pseudomonadota bacterium]
LAITTFTAQPNPVLLGNSVTYTITVRNKGTQAASGIVVEHRLATLVNISQPIETTQGECSSTASQVTCSLGSLDSNATATITVIATPQTATALSSQVTVRSDSFDTNPADNTAEITTQVAETSTELSISAAVTPPTVSTDETLTYTLTLSNLGATDATEVTLDNQFSTAVTFVEAQNCTLARCTLATLAAGATETLTLKVKPQVAGSLNYTATLNFSDSDPANNTATISTTVTQSSTAGRLTLVETQRNGINNVQGLQGVVDLALSQDQNHLYAAGLLDNAISVFSRQADTGQLTFVHLLQEGVESVKGLSRASAVIVSPDDHHVYATGSTSGAVVAFERDMNTGRLTFIQAYQSQGAQALAMTNSHVYVAGNTDNAIALFSRDSSSGELTFVDSVTADSLANSAELTLTPNGAHLLATSMGNHSLTVFSRDEGNGQLTLVKSYVNNTEGIQGLAQPSSVVVSAEGQQVYALGRTANAIVLFNRALQSGELTYLESWRDDDQTIDGLGGAADLALDPQGQRLYVAAADDNALAIFQRNANNQGRLTFKEALKDLQGLGGAEAVVVSSDGKHIYVAGFEDNAIAVLQTTRAQLRLDIEDNADPVAAQADIVYTLTVTNAGTGSSEVDLALTLPPQTQFGSAQAQQGSCQQPVDNTLSCQLGTLAASATTTVTLTIKALEPGQRTLTATATPASGQAVTETETTQVASAVNADLSLALNAPALGSIDAELSYQLTLNNAGPEAAQGVKLTHVLAETVQWVAATEERCIFNDVTHTITCQFNTLAVNAAQTVTLTIRPTAAGILTHEATLTSNSFDTNTDNNRATATTEITQNIIEDTFDNTDNTLQNYVIAPSGAVIGGALAGHIVNHGLLSAVQILPNSVINGDGQTDGALCSGENGGDSLGKLSKEIVNEGIIENVRLLSGTLIKGGVLRGKIYGFPGEPATLKAKVAAGAQLAHVTIAIGSEVDPQAILCQGVRFVTNSLIPPEIELTRALEPIQEPLTQRQTVALSSDVLVEGPSLLASINQLAELTANQLAFNQLESSGDLRLPAGDDVFILAPIHVRQIACQPPATECAGISLNPDGSVQFITAQHRLILAEPSIQDPPALQAALAALGLPEYTAHQDGNLTIPVSPQLYFKTRPDKVTQLTSPFEPLGLEELPEAIAAGLNPFILRFDDNSVRRQHYFYPAPAHRQELQRALQGIPQASSVKFQNNGTVSVKIGGRIYRGAFDYSVIPGPASQVTQLLISPDQNGDGHEDLQIIYANGDKQTLFVLPLPDLVAQIQVIPDVEQQNYVVTQNAQEHLVLTQELKRLELIVTHKAQLREEKPPQMTIYPDGSALFVTETGQQVHAQPAVQNLAALEAALEDNGLSGVIVEGHGNLMVPVDKQFSYSARPDLESRIAWITLPFGIHSVPAQLANVSTVLLVFRDELGLKRQQLIYPAAKDPQSLYTFFAHIPSLEFLLFDNDGTVTVRSREINFKGIFAYGVEAGHVATGGIQFSETTDRNGDGINDFVVTYADGERQVIYQMP